MASAIGASALLHLALIASLAPAPAIPGAAPLTARLRTIAAEAPPAPADETAGLALAQAAAPTSERPGADPRPGIELPMPPRYFRSSELDERAIPIDKPLLLYPEAAWQNRLPGLVMVRVFISERGTVDSAEVVDALPAGVFETAALDAVRKVRYRPAAIAGRAVKSQKLIEVKFDPNETPPASEPPKR
jgi:protein TonB